LQTTAQSPSSLRRAGSDYQVIPWARAFQKAAILFALAVWRQHKQRFVLSEKDGNHSKILFTKFLDKEQTKQVLVKFQQQ